MTQTIALNVVGLGLLQQEGDDACEQLSPEGASDFTWTCTQPLGHEGLHVAGDGSEACFIWGVQP